MTDSPFNANSTTDDVLAGIDMSGKRVLITGASGGLGAEAARALAAHGAEVIIAARDHVKTEQVIAAIRAESPAAEVHSVTLELGDLEQVKQCAADVLNKFDRLDVVIANAGIMATPFARTAQGFEQQIGVNHLGHFLLVNLLVPALVKTGNSRVVVLTSGGHKIANVALDDINFEHADYNAWIAYGRAKTANAQFAVGLNQRLEGQGVTVNAVHPGMIMTDLSRYMGEAEFAQLQELSINASEPSNFKTVPAGAATEVWAASSPMLEGKGGLYLEDCSVASPAIDGQDGGVMDYALDKQQADSLWVLSEQLVGQQFSF